MRKLMKLAAMLFAATMFFASCDDGKDNPDADYADGIVGTYVASSISDELPFAEFEVVITKKGTNEITLKTADFTMPGMPLSISIEMDMPTTKGDILGTYVAGTTNVTAMGQIVENVEVKGNILPNSNEGGVLTITVPLSPTTPIIVPIKLTKVITDFAPGIVGEYSGLGQATGFYEGNLEIEITEKGENEVTIVTGDIIVETMTIPAINTTLTTSAGDAGAIAVDGELTVSVELIPGTPMPVPVTITGSIEPKTGIGLLTITATVEGAPIPVPIAVTRKTAE